MNVTIFSNTPIDIEMLASGLRNSPGCRVNSLCCVQTPVSGDAEVVALVTSSPTTVPPGFGYKGNPAQDVSELKSLDYALRRLLNKKVQLQWSLF